eukprot:scaffold407206_cov41-Prasinocladus_malaysianus.AAC.1
MTVISLAKQATPQKLDQQILTAADKPRAKPRPWPRHNNGWRQSVLPPGSYISIYAHTLKHTGVVFVLRIRLEYCPMVNWDV